MSSVIRCFLLFLILSAAATSSVAQQLPVLLMLNKSEQNDSTGYNFISSVTELIYAEIIENRLKLWESQKKEINISASTLQTIEKSSGISFRDQETIFIFELWEKTRSEIVTKTAGFSFIHKRNTRDEVIFGYIDFKDIEELFTNKKIHSNASGNFSTTFMNALLAKNYYYHLVQLGDKMVRTTNEGQDLKLSYTRGTKFNQSLLGYYPPDKAINWIFDTFTDDGDLKSINSKRIGRQLEDFFIKNQEVFFNMGGERIVSHMSRNKIKVTKIEVHEIWRKTGTEILYDPKSVTIFVNDMPLDIISNKNMEDFEFRISESDIFSFLRTREFNIIITRINSEDIKRKDAFMFYKGLMNSEWNKLNQYVLNY